MWAPAGGGAGPIDPKRLPEGYPYKEQSEQVIEWDGNTDGLTKVGSNWYKVSDIAFPDLNGCKVTVNLGTMASLVGADRVDAELNYAVAEGDLHGYTFTLNVDGESMEMGAVAVIPEGSTNYEPGTYFFAGANGSYYTERLTAMAETIHPMAPEFLPALTSPNGTKYQLTVADDGTLSAVAVS